MYGQYLSLVVLWAYASSGALAQQATAVPDLESKQFHEVSQAEIAVYLPLKRQQDRHLPVNDRVVFFAKRALGQPFRLGGGISSTTQRLIV